MTCRTLFKLGAAVFCFFQTFGLSKTFAQLPPVLSLQPNGGASSLNITGDAGSACTVQFATNLSADAAWLTLSNFTLLSSPSSVVDPGGATHQQRFYRVAIFAPANSSWIPAGTFTMGSPTNELVRNLNETQHVVTLTKGFYLSKFPVTQGNYWSLMGTNPGWFTPGNNFSLDLTRPVEQVSWSDATNYCARLTQQVSAAGRIFTNWVYRLPTEAEWEYSCRAGTPPPFYHGASLFAGMANFNGQYEYVGGAGTTNASGVSTFLGRTTSVGSYQPNAPGLYDMAGNVWEWCADWFGSYSTNGITNPQGPGTGSARVFRGGTFNSIGADCRSAKRNSADPSTVDNNIGFRVVLSGP